jgi:hypothetical protein
MIIPIRIECPHCHWGHLFNNSYINQGQLKGKCNHCEKIFFFKVTIMGFSVETNKELPDDVPCMTLLEAKSEIKDNLEGILNDV